MRIAFTAVLFCLSASAMAHPWDDAKLPPDKRAELALKAMTEDEKLTLVAGQFGSMKDGWEPPAEARMGSAGYVPGITRLGIPPLWETDAGVGVATQGHTRDKVRERTSLPSGLATAATWNPQLAFAGGAMIGAEARDAGFNVMLAGGVNLMREPRNGRNFEYAGEDPLLAGTMVGNEIAGIQSNHIISTIKHYALNDQESGRHSVNVQIDEAAAKQSDLLAFKIAMEKGNPGSVMCAYNLVWGDYACESSKLLNDILKKQWGFKGFVMSDWGAVYSTAKAANAGLDQESALQFDNQPYFAEPLKKALQDGGVAKARLDDMVRRILYAMFANGVIDHPVQIKDSDYMAHAAVTQADAEEGIVLLKNQNNALPLSPAIHKLAVIGGHADAGVMAGGGSSMVYPIAGNAVPGLAPTDWPGPVMFHPSSPLRALKSRLPNTEIGFAAGGEEAVNLARQADAAIVFVTQWTAESIDASLQLADDPLVAAVAAVNPRTIVVVESGGPVLMPWSGQVAGIVEAWYPGTSGGEAIARVLLGEVDASGRLPATFPRGIEQTPHPVLVDKGDVTYDEGAMVGYRWYDAKGLTPLYPFGYGLSYSRFKHDGLTATIDNGKLKVSFVATNIGERAGKDVPQLYVGGRLAGWQKLELKPGQSQTVSVTIDRRLVNAMNGVCEIKLGTSSRDLELTASVRVPPTF